MLGSGCSVCQGRRLQFMATLEGCLFRLNDSFGHGRNSSLQWMSNRKMVLSTAIASAVGTLVHTRLLAAGSTGQYFRRRTSLWSVGIRFGENFRGFAGSSFVLVVVSNIASDLLDQLGSVFAKAGRFFRSLGAVAMTGLNAMTGPDARLCIIVRLDHYGIGQVTESRSLHASVVLQRTVVSFPFGTLHWLEVRVGILVLIWNGRFGSR